MVINEKGLLKAIRKKFQKGGYYVGAADHEELGVCMVIQTFEWAAAIQWDNIPRKVLGLVAEHVGKLPAVGDAYHVHKKEVQDAIYDVAFKPLQNLQDHVCRPEKSLPWVKKTRLTWDGQNGWQRGDNLGIILVDPEYEDVLEVKNNPVQLVEGALFAEGELSQVFIMPVSPGADNKPMIDHLGQMQWVNWQ